MRVSVFGSVAGAVLLPLLLCGVVGAAPAPPSSRTEVTALPGYGTLPSRMWTGHIKAGQAPNGGEQFMFYWFVECEECDDPSTAPIVVWYQGGPGASSLFGMFVEFGPLLLTVDSLRGDEYNRTGIPQLQRNPHTWSRAANLVFIDNPAPVGFSYCTPAGPSGAGPSCGAWNDSYVGVSNKIMLDGLAATFTDFSQSQWFIFGESYAGVYVPVIARALLQDAAWEARIAGMSVNDGCLGTEVLCGSAVKQNGPYYYIEWFHGHGAFSNKLYRRITADCPEVERRYGNMTQHCKDLVADMFTQIGGYYGYNYLDDCTYEEGLGSPTPKNLPPSSLGSVNGYPCRGDALAIYLNRTDVRDAIGVPHDAFFFSGDNGAGFSYTLTEPNVLPFYLHVITNTSIRVMVVQGSEDPGIIQNLTEDLWLGFLDDNDVAEAEAWRPFTLDGIKRMGGGVVSYDGGFSYVSVRGAGHMIPEFVPPFAFEYFHRFLADEPLQRYNPKADREL